MPYQIRLDMGPSRFAIMEAVKNLCETQPTVSVMDIALHIKCSRRTIERHLPTLIEAGLVHKPADQRSKKLGFRYTCRKAANGTPVDGC